MTKVSTVFTLLAVSLLAACSTSPVRPVDAKPVPRDRLYITTPATSSDGMIVVVRDAGFQGHACAVSIFLDGQKAASLASGEKAEFPVPSGKHMLTAAPAGKGLCGIADSERAQRRSLIFYSVAGRAIDFRVGVGAGGDPVFYQTSM